MANNDMTDKEIWDYIYSYIGNEYGTAAVMGNLKAESNMQSNNLQQTYEYLGSDESYTSAVDSGSYSREKFINDSAGYGLAQWTYSTRKANLYDYCKKNNLSIGSTKAQVGFLMEELKSSSSVYNTLQNATNVKDASNAILHDFERPANQSSSVENTRSNYGQEYYSSYSGKSTKLTSEQIAALGGGELSNQNLEIKVDTVTDVVASWLAIFQSIDFDSLNIRSAFTPLTSCGVLTSYIPSLEETLNSISEMVVSTGQMIKSAIDEQSSIDDSFQNTNDSSEYRGSGRRSGGDVSGSNDSNSTSVDNSSAPIDIESTLTDISDIDDDSLVSLISSLYYMDAKGQIDLNSYLDDIKYAENLKILLLLSPNIPSDLKKILSNMDPKTLQTFLKKMVGNTQPKVNVDETTIITTYNYLRSLSSSTGKDINTLTTSLDVSDTLIEVEKSLDKITNNEQEGLRYIYNGNTTEKEMAVNYLRNAVDYISDKNKISPDELLNNTAYNKTLVTALDNLKTTIKSINGLDNNSKANVLKSIVTASAKE